LYEGFGIPPLEAMAAGTIPVVSETASLPEVVGPGGILVDPYSIDDIARGLQEAIEWSGSVREEKVAAGRQYMKRFSWESSARLVLDVLHGIGDSVRSAKTAKKGQNI
ncbi:MAG: glycosyltransferase, partial [Patescibacteria group bacterium]